MGFETATHFLNVDLDVYSKAALDPIAAAFGKKVEILYVGRERRRYSAHFELSGSGAETARQADRLVRQLVQLVKKLPRTARRLWNGAAVREFNLGIEAVADSAALEVRLQAATLKAVASVNARLLVTVYAPQSPGRKRVRLPKPLA